MHARVATRPKRWRRLGLAALAVALVAPVGSGAPASAEPAEPADRVPARALEAAASAPSRYVPLDPRRLADTRLAGGALAAGSTRDFDVTAAGVPAGAAAVVVNVTMTDAAAWGFAALYPTGAARPAVSSVNVSGTGETAAVADIVAIGERASIRVYSSVRAHYVVDVTGYFVPASEASEGRFQALVPARALDTRGGPQLAPLSDVRVGLAGAFGVPASGASAVAISITAVDAAGAGWVQARPTGGTTRVGASSNLNLSYAGQTVANLAILPLGRDGSITVHVATRTHLLVDVVGWFTDAGAPASPVGLYVPSRGARLVDTRGGAAMQPGASLPIAAHPFTPQTVDPSALFVRITAIDSTSKGYATVFPALPRPMASNLNVDRVDQTIAGSALVAVDAATMAFRLYSSAAAHYAVDASGFFVRGERVPGGARCIVSLHGKGGGGQPPHTDGAGVRRLFPAGNAPGWGGRHWVYFPEDTYQNVAAGLATLVRDSGCGRTVIYGFSNGAAFAAKLYCRGESFGGTLVGVVIDDPVVDEGVLGCSPAPLVRAALYWTGGIDQPDGWNCAEGDWTCDGGRTIGIARYEAALGTPRKASIHTEHRAYDDPPELTSWL